MEEQELMETGKEDVYPSRVLPDRNICDAKPIGSVQIFGSCLVKHPADCPYVLDLSEGFYLCKHPNWREFVQ
jgi:hypothetical protein